MIAEPTAFETIVRERSWDWLVELQRRLGVELQLVSAQLTPLLPQPPVGGLAVLLSQPESSLQSALTAAFMFRRPQAMTIDGNHVACVALGSGRRAPGVLVVSRVAAERTQDIARVRDRLELIASWLSTAVEAHIESPPGMHASGLDRVSSLCQLLTQDNGPRADRELIRLFGEALAIWFDVDVYGYVETPRSTFARDTTLPGADDAAPTTLPIAGLPESVSLTRLPQGHADRFGFPPSALAYVARLRQHEGPSWLIVLSGPIDHADLERLDACVAVLRVSLDAHAAGATTEAVTAVAGRLMTGGAVDACATEALSELRERIDASSAALTIDGADGHRAVHAVARRSEGRSPDPASTARLVVARRVEGGGTVNLALANWDGRHFSPQEHQVAAAVAAAFERWSHTLSGWQESGRERRRSASRFEHELEAFAAQALTRGVATTTIVVSAAGAIDVPGLTQRWVSGIRGQMRASDLVGALGDGEVAVLLHDATAEHAARAVTRVMAVVTASGNAGEVRVGVATRQPGDQAAGVVHDARRRAITEDPHARPGFGEARV